MPNLAQLLTTKSTAEHQRILELCRDVSADIESVDGVYVVGGFVRDVILGRTPGDLDISIVGDAGAFANALATGLGRDHPVESQFLTFRLNSDSVTSDTERQQNPAIDIDVVTARSEVYSSPGALPEVTPSSIEEDLKRRDFTVNSMAISLSAASWGNLVDPVGGFGDIMRKRIRVLHDSSFVDDPTRMYRATRYATRLGFSIDARAESLIASSLEYVDRLSGARIRSEFELILAEPARVEIIRMSEELGLIGAISPGLRIGSKSLQVLESPPSTAIEDLLALTMFGLSREEAEQTARRFDGPEEWSGVIMGFSRLADVATVLDSPDIRRSEVAEILDAIALPSVRAYIVAGPPLPRRDRMVDYVEKIRFEKPEITGNDLIAAGIPEGPTIGRLIDLVTRARLDGQVRTKQDELKLAKSRLPGFLTEPV